MDIDVNLFRWNEWFNPQAKAELSSESVCRLCTS